MQHADELWRGRRVGPTGSLDGPSKTIIVEPVRPPVPVPLPTVEPAPREPERPRPPEHEPTR